MSILCCCFCVPHRWVVHCGRGNWHVANKNNQRRHFYGMNFSLLLKCITLRPDGNRKANGQAGVRKHTHKLIPGTDWWSRLVAGGREAQFYLLLMGFLFEFAFNVSGFVPVGPIAAAEVVCLCSCLGAPTKSPPAGRQAGKPLK